MIRLLMLFAVMGQNPSVRGTEGVKPGSDTVVAAVGAKVLRKSEAKSSTADAWIWAAVIRDEFDRRGLSLSLIEGADGCLSSQTYGGVTTMKEAMKSSSLAPTIDRCVENALCVSALPASDADRDEIAEFYAKTSSKWPQDHEYHQPSTTFSYVQFKGKTKASQLAAASFLESARLIGLDAAAIKLKLRIVTATYPSSELTWQGIEVARVGLPVRPGCAQPNLSTSVFDTNPAHQTCVDYDGLEENEYVVQRRHEDRFAYQAIKNDLLMAKRTIARRLFLHRICVASRARVIVDGRETPFSCAVTFE